MQKHNVPVIILVAPQLAVNVGMIARVMLNFSFSELRIVTPRDKDVINNALAASAGADCILKNSKIFDSLKEAVSDLNIVYATSKRMRYLNKPVNNLFNVFSNSELLKENYSSQKRGFLFGKEASGLSNNDLNYANILITIDTNTNFSSLNLVQAVALLCYEWVRSKSTILNLNDNKLDSEQIESNKITTKRLLTKSLKKTKLKVAATFNDLEYFFNYLETQLTNKQFFTAEKKTTMVRNFRNIFLKNQLSRSEVRTLFSIVKALSNNS